MDNDYYSHNEEAASSRISRLTTLLFVAIALETGVLALLVRSYWPNKGSTSFIYSPPGITCCRYDNRFYTHHPVSGHCVLSEDLQKECNFVVQALSELYMRSQGGMCKSGAYYDHSIVISSTDYPLLADLRKIDSNCLPNSLTGYIGFGSNVSLSPTSYARLKKSVSWPCLQKSIQLAFYCSVAALVILLLAIFVFDEWRRRRIEKATIQTKLINATYQVIIFSSAIPIMIT